MEIHLIHIIVNSVKSKNKTGSLQFEHHNVTTISVLNIFFSFPFFTLKKTYLNEPIL